MNKEKQVECFGGWVCLFINIFLTLVFIGLLLYGAKIENGWAIFISIAGLVVTSIAWGGFFAQEPNEARALILFGAYNGTAMGSGFFWTNPFYRRVSISLRSRNFDGDKLKVNDKAGNPIEISAVVVWKVADTAQALFDVDDFVHFVRVQSDSAIRQLANNYAYDHGEADELTLRSGREEISSALQKELQERLDRAGVLIEESRLNHLAYAPEIAAVMLKRQQAEAIIAARSKIVDGAVSMVDMALKHLAEKKVVELDEEKKASMVSNLLVILCGETEAQPIINTGTLYS
ncbi:SPFH domain-containing protein [Candidatus Riflebacteria bacterium]